MKKLYHKIAGLPVGAVAAAMGAATLSNVWFGMGYGWIRGVTMGCGIIVWLAALIKIAGHFKTFQGEYAKTVPASLYAAFTMLLMILSTWLYQWIPQAAKALFLAAVFLHIAHILIFTFRNVLRGVAAETFVPSWFVTYNGLLVSTVTGAVHLPGPLAQGILYYGLGVYILIIPFMVFRLRQKPVPPALLHTKPVVLAPVSLCLVSCLNVAAAPAAWLLFALYGMLLLSLLYILVNIPRFFAVPFNPGFAGLTFPMAIGTVASNRMAAWLSGAGYEPWGAVVRELGGIQTYLTTAIIAFVAFNFIRMLRSKK